METAPWAQFLIIYRCYTPKLLNFNAPVISNEYEKSKKETPRRYAPSG